MADYPTATGGETTVGQGGPRAAQTVVAMGMFVGTSLIIEAVTRTGAGLLARPLAQVAKAAFDRAGLLLEKGILFQVKNGIKRELKGSAKAAMEQVLEREFKKALMKRIEYHVARSQVGKVLNRKLFPNDGIVNGAVQRFLGKGEWKEWVVVSKGATTPGAERLLTGNGQVWYSPNHYKGFIRIDDNSFSVVGSLYD
jgi:hypothetical protein